MQDSLFPLEFIFTKYGFAADNRVKALSPEDRERFDRYEENRFKALYEDGLRETAGAGIVSPSDRFLRLLSRTYFQSLLSLPDLELKREAAEAEFSGTQLEMLLRAVPFAIGSEYVTESWLQMMCGGLNLVFAGEIAAYDGPVSVYFAEKSQNLHVPERIFFHMVEKKGDEKYPFAFLATYATKTENGKVKHVPLSYALTEFRGERKMLLNLLACLNRAAEVSPLIAGFMETGEMFHPLRLTVQEAYQFLKDVAEIEKCGILCRIPDWWRRKYAAVTMNVRLGDKKPSLLGFDTLVSLKPRFLLDGEELTEREIRKLLKETEGLAFLKGKWVEVDHGKLEALLKSAEKLPDSVSLLDALRGDVIIREDQDADDASVSNGVWLRGLLEKLRRPETIRSARVPATFRGKLRGYQKSGYTWLNYMDELGFGACLADDMGLGKTVQVLCYLEHLRKSGPGKRALLVVPASLLGNWQKEAEKFAPEMPWTILHGTNTKAVLEQWRKEPSFLVITTYGMVNRLEGLQDIRWDTVILDEAQAIKNPGTRQTRAVKQLEARMRIAMTGTPIENELGNLWSLYDFLNRGLLGNTTEFREFTKGLEEHPEGYARLRGMISPFLLRRLKTDKSIISDLPDKLEVVDYTTLSKKQAVLYRKAVSDMEGLLEETKGMARRGLVLATIMKLKQICNHPDQYLGQKAFEEKDSGKLLMLREICETIREKRERVLVFTQFREITEELSEFLSSVFGMKGLVLHGGTRVKARQEIVERFQSEEYVPYLVLSVKAGGTGLNLTGANHVVHFDRWWNPAVEDQATDRAFRIGQEKDVVVHKLVCRGTIEERINDMLTQKKELSDAVIGKGGSEKWITELNDKELLELMRLR